MVSPGIQNHILFSLLRLIRDAASEEVQSIERETGGA